MPLAESWPSPDHLLGSLYDRLIHLNELFRIAGTVVPVDVAGFELVRPSDLSKWSCQSMEAAPSNIRNVSY
jgi:hypothetical protein